MREILFQQRRSPYEQIGTFHRFQSSDRNYDLVLRIEAQLDPRRQPVLAEETPAIHAIADDMHIMQRRLKLAHHRGQRIGNCNHGRSVPKYPSDLRTNRCEVAKGVDVGAAGRYYYRNAKRSSDQHRRQPVGKYVMRINAVETVLLMKALYAAMHPAYISSPCNGMDTLGTSG